MVKLCSTHIDETIHVLYHIYWESLYEYYPNDNDLLIQIAIYEDDVSKLKKAIKDGGNLDINLNDLNLRYCTKITDKRKCFIAFRHLFVVRNLKNK